MTNIVKQEYQVQSIAEIKSNIQIIQKVLDGVMKKGCHFDIIPGCGAKPTLLKPGAETIMATFRLGGEPIIEKETDGFDIVYTVKYRGFHIPTNNTVGYGIGRCSTAEKKYAWREAVCQEEFDETPETQRQIYWKKSGNKAIKVLQVRQSPADIANTVLKMAEKRAQIDFVRTSTGCSDMFAQDLDEEHIREAVREQSQFQEPQAKPAQQPQGNVISEAQRKRFYAMSKQAGYDTNAISEWLMNAYGFESSAHITRDKYNEICAAIENKQVGKC